MADPIERIAVTVQRENCFIKNVENGTCFQNKYRFYCNILRKKCGCSSIIFLASTGYGMLLLLCIPCRFRGHPYDPSLHGCQTASVELPCGQMLRIKVAAPDWRINDVCVNMCKSVMRGRGKTYPVANRLKREEGLPHG